MRKLKKWQKDFFGHVKKCKIALLGEQVYSYEAIEGKFVK